MADKFFDAMFTASVLGGSSGPAPVIVSKNITANGTYSALDDQADGFNPVVVDVPNSYTAGDEGKVVSNGQLVAQTDYGTVTKNGTFDTTTNNSITVAIPETPNFELIKTSCSPSLNYRFSDNWSAKTWNGMNQFSGTYIWTDGTDIYYSYNKNQYVLDRETSAWQPKTWSGLTNFSGSYIWTNGTDIYYSDGSNQYVLDKATSTWSTKSWSGLTSFSGGDIWTDSTVIYYSNDSDQYVLDKATSTWQPKSWMVEINFNSGDKFWTDGTDIYYSNGSRHYVLGKAPKRAPSAKPY